mgnify:CR=1 FL=1|jgi:nicotinamidase-related amidase
MLKKENTALIIIDVQGKLAQIMHNRDLLFQNFQALIKGTQALKIPVIWVEQLPDKLGATIPEIADILKDDMQPISKYTFSACGNEDFLKALKQSDRKQILITGIETHICVYQTCIDLLNMGYEVHAVTDAVSSRTYENKQLGLEKMKNAGADITSVETALFEILKAAKGSEFKEIVKIVK